MPSVIYAFKRLQCLYLHFKDFNVFSHLRFQKTTMSSFKFQRLQCLQSFMHSKDYNVFIYISKTWMSSVIYAFKRLQCLHSHFQDFNVFSHLRFQNTTMSSFTFPRLQCLQSFMLSKDCNVFIYISKTSMSSVIYAFKRLRLQLHFKDFHVFCLLHFTRLLHFLSFIWLNVLVFVLHRTRRPLFLCFEKNNSNVFCSIGGGAKGSFQAIFWTLAHPGYLWLASAPKLLRSKGTSSPGRANLL